MAEPREMQTGKAIPDSLYTSRPGITIAHLPDEEVIQRLNLSRMPAYVQRSVLESKWQVFDGGRVLLEARSPLKIAKFQSGDPNAVSTHVIDMDDCLLDTTRWREKEIELTEKFGINGKAARSTYEGSKLQIKGIAELEPRYTPEVHLIMLSQYAHLLRQGLDQPEINAQMKVWRAGIMTNIEALGEAHALSGFARDPKIERAFLSNNPKDFVHYDFASDVIQGTGEADLRIIATRGKPEGPLGQIYKAHKSGLLKRYPNGNKVDLVVYANDVKAKTLLDVIRLLPGIERTMVRVLDDRPGEITPYLNAARDAGINNVEVIQVSHPTAKSKGEGIGIEPDFTYVSTLPNGNPGTIYRHYFVSPGWPLKY